METAQCLVNKEDVLTELTNLSLVAATIGQIGLCLTLLLRRSSVTRAWIPLFVFFLACAVIIADPVIKNFMPSMRIQAVVFTLPASLILTPALWLYVEALTSEIPWKFRQEHTWHLIPFMLGFFLAGIVIALPQPTLDRIFIEEDLGGSRYLGILFTAVFLLIFGLIAQSGIYIVKIYRRLTRYRHRIKALFANIENRELFWINAVLILLITIWGLISTALIAENIFGKTLMSRQVGSLMGLILVWTVALWGLRQVPGFEGRYLESEFTDLIKPQGSKYRRSALDKEQAQRIAKKINLVMQSERLYLDPNLSLSRLASQIRTSTNHVSQTLNETLGMSFFDYINHWRIEESKQKIIQGNESILAIALSVGFNTSSSFYKAFKKETGKTPRGFRASKQQ